MKIIEVSLLIAAVVATWASAVVSEAKDDRVRLDCESVGSRDVSMDARFEVESDRTKFDASFEAAPIGVFGDGDTLQVYVAGEYVGDMVLITQLNGDLEGDLEYDTQADEGNPFPADFPEVGEGTSVMVGKLGCALE